MIYEMLTGFRPFEGKSSSDTLAAVLRQNIHWAQLPHDTPDELRRLLRRCLQRDPKNRLHDAADARLILAEMESDYLAGRIGGSQWRRRMPWLLAGVATAAVAVAGALAARGIFAKSPAAEPPPPVIRFAIEPPPEVMNVSSVAVAADGRFAVYEAQVEGEFRFFMRRFDAIESRPVAGTEGARGPFLSPDGAWIGFVRNAKLFKVSTAGGDALAVTDVQGGPGSTWDADGKRIIFSRAWLSGLSVVSADGGTPTVLTNPDRNKQEMATGGRPRCQTAACCSRSFAPVPASTMPDRAARSRQERVPRPVSWRQGDVGSHRTHPVLPDGPVSRGGVRCSGNVTGEPFPVIEDAQELDPAGDWGQPVSVASGGVLAYLPGHYVPPSKLTWIDRRGRSRRSHLRRGRSSASSCRQTAIASRQPVSRPDVS